MHRSGAAMAWNVFRFCTALRGLGSLMILLVLAVVGVSYYAVVVTTYAPSLWSASGLEDILVDLAVLLPFHGLLGMLLWCYFSVVLTDPGSVPPNWRPTSDEEAGDAVPLTSTEFDIVGFQPSTLHADIVNSRFYTFLETTLVTISLLPHFIAFFSDVDIPGTPGTLATTFLAFVLNLAFSLSVLGFLIMHMSLVGSNTTTIEAYEKKTTPKWRYDLGRRKNFEQVFGTDKRYWFIPAYSEEDLRRIPALQGLEYPSKPELESQEF